MGNKVKKCISCDGKEFVDYSSGVVKCSNCGLVVAQEIPTSKEVSELYKKEYFFGMEYSDYKVDRPALERNFKKRIKRMSFMLNPEYKVAEVGCAYGYFLNLLQDKVASSIGFDVSEDGVEYAKEELGVNATTEDFLNHKFKKNELDSIFMWDVIEHFAHPEDYIKRSSEVLKSGGHLALTTGDVEALVPKIKKGKWRMIHPPTHVYYFSPTTLGLLLEKHNFKVISVKHTSVSRNVGSVFNQLISNKKAVNKGTSLLSSMQKLAEMSKLDKLNIPLNTLDIMEVVAVKR